VFIYRFVALETRLITVPLSSKKSSLCAVFHLIHIKHGLVFLLYQKENNPICFVAFLIFHITTWSPTDQIQIPLFPYIQLSRFGVFFAKFFTHFIIRLNFSCDSFAGRMRWILELLETYLWSPLLYLESATASLWSPSYWIIGKAINLNYATFRFFCPSYIKPHNSMPSSLEENHSERFFSCFPPRSLVLSIYHIMAA